MTSSELYERISISDLLELLTFLNESNDAIRLVFLKAEPNSENTTAFQGLVKVLAQKQLNPGFIATAEIQSLYTHLAFFFKKSNNRAFVDACVTHIHESVFKKRLSAWLHQKRYNYYKSHISEFPKYLSKLSAARIEGDEDYTYEILNDLHEYRYKTVANLPSDVKEKMEGLFANHDIWNEFPIVRQLHLEELDQLPDIAVVDYTGKEYMPSEFADDLFRRSFVDYVRQNSLFGYGIVEATEQIIRKGQANFDEGYQGLTSDDVVKIYCYCNMRMHYYSSLCIYERSELVNKFYKTSGRIKFIDIGCGPATSGLAFAEHIYEQTGESASFDYYGIDRSQSMKKKAQEIMANNIFLESNHSNYYADIGEIDINGLAESSCIIINACYVFASPSLSHMSIVNFINTLKQKYPFVPKYLLFQNPIGTQVNLRYLEFKVLLKKYEVQFSENEEIKYYNQRRWSDKAKERGIYYEILKL
jgi:hypothetical protein